MNLSRWLDPAKKEFKLATEAQLGGFYLEYKEIINELTEEQKKEINKLINQTFIIKRNDGTMPVITFAHWLNFIENLAKVSITRQKQTLQQQQQIEEVKEEENVEKVSENIE